MKSKENSNTKRAGVAVDAIVRLSSLFEGDRFVSHDALWTYLGPTGDGKTATARKHGKESMAMGDAGYGYIGDALCSFMLRSKVHFVPPNVRDQGSAPCTNAINKKEQPNEN